jgi:hypothetical integral membrane protein (TIGR02206 family)
MVRWGQSATEPQRRATRWALALTLAGYAVAAYYRALVVNRTELQYFAAQLLPLHLCDLLLFTSLWALFRRGQTAFEFTYFATIAGALPASLTPDLRSGFPSFAFIHFFWGHGGLMLILAWLIGVEGMRPLPGCLRRMAVLCLAYVAMVGALNLALGWNYGYLARKPASSTALDYLGPWPWYLVVGWTLAFGVFWLLWLPWRRIPVSDPAFALNSSTGENCHVHRVP